MELISNTPGPAITSNTYTVTLPAYGYTFYQVSASATEVVELLIPQHGVTRSAFHIFDLAGRRIDAMPSSCRHRQQYISIGNEIGAKEVFWLFRR